MLNEPVKLPSSVKWLAAMGIITAVYPLYSDLPWQVTGPASAFKTWSIIFSWIEFPLNLLLLAASFAILKRGYERGRVWMLWWAAAVTIYESIPLLIMTTWVVPRANIADFPDPWGISGFLGADAVRSSYLYEYPVYWISMISLSGYAWWVLTRPSVREFYESPDGTARPSLSEDAPVVPPT
jgi:hypothetical protein